MNRALTLQEAADRVGVSVSTLRRWVRAGVVPGVAGGHWSDVAVAHARVAARLRERGHSLEEIRQAAAQGRLAYGLIEEMFPAERGPYSLADAARETGLEAALIQRWWTGLGLPSSSLESLTEEDLQALRHAASVLDSGLPLVAFLQLGRVYGQALARIADAETRLFHIYVHEPLMREGLGGVEMSEQMQSLARDLLPLTSPLMDYLHQRLLSHYLEQDVVGHMELELDGEVDLGRLRVAICFCDLAGYTRYTEEEGELEALSYVERFVTAVADTLPDDARVVKTIGDEVMVVAQDVQAITDWAVGFLALFDQRPEPRIGIHQGAVLYRDGDYFGRAVNLASRVVARARGGEAIVSGDVVARVSETRHLSFEPVGQVKLKGIDAPVDLYRADTPRR